VAKCHIPKEVDPQKMPCVKMNFQNIKTLLMLTPHDNQIYSVQVSSGTPGFQVFTILSTFKGPRQVLDFFTT